MTSTARAHRDPTAYRVRVLGCTALAVGLLAALFALWPPPDPAPPAPYSAAQADRAAAIEMVVRTSQPRQAAPPPPPPDLPPVIAEEVPLDEIDLELDVPLTLDPGPPAPPAEQSDGDAERSASPTGPTRGPQRVRGAQPAYPEAARRAGVQAEIRLRVTVEPNGQPTAPTIVDRKLIDGDRKTTVARLGYGLEEAALAAAREWLFRPALVDGQRVRQDYTITMQFGTRR